MATASRNMRERRGNQIFLRSLGYSAACRRKVSGNVMSATMKFAKSCAASGSALRSARLRGGGISWPLSIIARAQSSKASAVQHGLVERIARRDAAR